MDTPELALYRKILQKENQLVRDRGAAPTDAQDFRFPEHLLGELRRFFSVHPLECVPPQRVGPADLPATTSSSSAHPTPLAW